MLIAFLSGKLNLILHVKNSKNMLINAKGWNFEPFIYFAFKNCYTQHLG